MAQPLDPEKWSVVRKEQIQAHKDYETLIRECTRPYGHGTDLDVLDLNGDNLERIDAAVARMGAADEAVLRFLRGDPTA